MTFYLKVIFCNKGYIIAMDEKKNITPIDEVSISKTSQETIKDTPPQKPRPLRLSRKTSDGTSTGYSCVYDFEKSAGIRSLLD